MDFSLWTAANQPWDSVMQTARYSDAGPWRTLYIADHFMAMGVTEAAAAKPMHEATAALAAIAGETSRVRLAPLVLGMTYRHPAVLANWAATFDHASGGRLTLGLGAGWQQNEHDFYGIRLGPPAERVQRFIEGLEIIVGLLGSTATTVDGTYYQVSAAPAEPKPLQSPLPILVGATGPKMLRQVATHAAEWNCWSTPGDFAAQSAKLDIACEQVGRDPGTIHRSTQARLVLTDDRDKAAEAVAESPLPTVAGPIETIVDAVQTWQDEGADEVIVRDDSLGQGSERRDALDSLTEAFKKFRS